MFETQPSHAYLGASDSFKDVRSDQPCRGTSHVCTDDPAQARPHCSAYCAKVACATEACANPRARGAGRQTLPRACNQRMHWDHRHTSRRCPLASNCRTRTKCLCTTSRLLTSSSGMELHACARYWLIMSQELRTQRHAAVAPRTVGQSTRLAAQTVVRPCHGDASCDQPCRFTEDTIAQIMHVYPDAFQLEQVCACPNSTCLAEEWQVAVTGSLVAHGAIQMQIKPPVVVGVIKCFLKQSHVTHCGFRVAHGSADVPPAPRKGLPSRAGGHCQGTSFKSSRQVSLLTVLRNNTRGTYKALALHCPRTRLCSAGTPSSSLMRALVTRVPPCMRDITLHLHRNSQGAAASKA